MRKLLSVLLSGLLVFHAAVVLTAPAFAAEDESLDAWTSELDKIPDDAFDGNYTTVDNPDGSKTHFFENGSVGTEYPDGRKDGVDYKGNVHTMDQDQNVTYHLPNGVKFTDAADGTKSFSRPNGRTTVINQDLSSKEIFTNLGIEKEFDAEGHCTGVGFIGGDEKLETDENGDLKDGEIKGPNGASLTVNGDEKHFVTPTGDTVDYKETGIEDSAEGCTESISITYKDGATAQMDKTTKVERGADGVATGRTVDCFGAITTPDGEKLEYNQNQSYDTDGNMTASNNNVGQTTYSDGSTLWFDNNSNAWSYENPKDGSKIVVDANGNLTEGHVNGEDWHVVYNDDGSIKSADISLADGGKIVQNPDGSSRMTLPDGTEFTSDGKGNIYKNGEQIKKDGEWVSGKNPNEEETAEPEEEAEEEESEEEETPEPEEPETPEPEASGVSVEDFMGTWHFTVSYGDWSTNATWSMRLSGNQVIATSSAEGESESFTCSYKLEGDKLILNGEFSTVSFVLQNGTLHATADGETVVMHR